MTHHTETSEEKPIGHITHYYNHISVAAIDLTEHLAVGEKIHIKGHTTDVIVTVDSMQIEHENVKEAGPGSSIGIKVADKVRPGDAVFRVK